MSREPVRHWPALCAKIAGSIPVRDTSDAYGPAVVRFHRVTEENTKSKDVCGYLQGARIFAGSSTAEREALNLAM